MYEIKPFRFLLWWIGTAIFAIPVSVIAVSAVSIPVAMLFTLLSPPVYETNFTPFYNLLGVVLIYPLIGTIVALVIANLQRWLLRKMLYWEADNWLKFSALGGFAAGIGLYISYVLGLGIDSNPNAFALNLALAFGIISGFQVIALRSAVKHAWLWVIANMVAIIVFSGLVLNNPLVYANQADEINFFGLIALAAVSLGLITGFVMLYLFERHSLLPSKSDELMQNLPEQSSPKSVWDDAI